MSVTGSGSLTLRIVSWNCGRANATSGVWDYLLALAPDVAVLQEVSGLPETITSTFAVETAKPITKDGREQRFSTVVLAKGEISNARPLVSRVPWIATQLDRFGGNLTQMTIRLPGFSPIDLVAVYSPAWPIDRAIWAPEESDGVKLDLNADLWVADLLHAAWKERAPSATEWVVVAGDFNLCESFDWRRKPRGNLEYLTRLQSLGLKDALRSSQGALTPTFKGPRSAIVANQLDYIFLTEELSARLQSCGVGEAAEVIGKLSDHLPVIADLA